MRRSHAFGGSPRTVYVGGGTPSCLGAERLVELLEAIRRNFDVSEVCEWTVECNPEDVNPELAGVLASGGVNRVSMGAQSLFDPALRMMGRRHDAGKVAEAVSALRAAGVDSISVDCIFGLPRVDGYSAVDDFERFVSLGVEHISAYSLQYEAGSRFNKMVEDGRLSPISDDEVADQYEELTGVMRSAGYGHYEISNYAMPGREAVHNSSYWARADYYGFGPAAASLVGNVRTTNAANVAAYVRTEGREKDLTEVLDTEDVYEEVVMLGLRTSKGVSPVDVPSAYKGKFLDAVRIEVENGNLVELPTGNYRIPEERWMISEIIIRSVALP